MNKWTILTIFFFTNIFSTFAQNEWANNYGSTNLDQGSDLLLDNFGNIYTTGFFEGTVDFDPSNTGTFNLTSVGQRDFYIAKYDELGQLSWAKGIGGGNQEYGKSMQIDASGNIYIAGDFNGLVDFDPSVGFSLQDVKGGSDIFIAKYNAQGDFIWVKTFGGLGIESVKDLIIDNLGNIYVAGIFQGTADFDPNGGVINLTSSGSFDSFILKLDSNGNYVWVKSIESTENNFINQIVLDYSGNINAVGYFHGTADFNPDSDLFEITSVSDKSAFFFRWTTQGEFINVFMISGSGFEVGKSVVVDVQNNVYITGEFRGVIDFDLSSNNNFITSSGLRDAFVAKYTAQGNLIWVDKIGGNGEDQATSITIGQNNELYVSGYFNGSMNLSNGENYTSAGASDAFFTRYSLNGDLVFATKSGGGNGDESAAITVNTSGDIFSTGWIQGTSIFGNASLQSNGDRDIFLAKIKMEGSSATSSTQFTAQEVEVFPNPNNGKFTLSLENLENDNLSIRIFDLSGREVFNQNYSTLGLSDFQTTINFDSSQSGLFLMRIESESKVITKKIMIN